MPLKTIALSFFIVLLPPRVFGVESVHRESRIFTAKRLRNPAQDLHPTRAARVGTPQLPRGAATLGIEFMNQSDPNRGCDLLSRDETLSE
jgi:hypothetical protein